MVGDPEHAFCSPNIFCTRSQIQITVRPASLSVFLLFYCVFCLCLYLFVSKIMITVIKFLKGQKYPVWLLCFPSQPSIFSVGQKFPPFPVFILFFMRAILKAPCGANVAFWEHRYAPTCSLECFLECSVACAKNVPRVNCDTQFH